MPIQPFRCDIAVETLPPQVEQVEKALLAALTQQGVVKPALLRWAIMERTAQSLVCEGAYTTPAETHDASVPNS